MSPLSNPGYRTLRIGRRSISAQLYLITWTTAQRKPRFLDPELAQVAARTVASADLWNPSRCLCWVLMPDQWHGLIELGEGANLSTIVQRIKGVTARRVNLCCPVDGPLWAKGFHDHALRRDEAIEYTARHIIANPMRAGLVTDPMDYPYWDADFLNKDAAWSPD